MVLDSTLRHEVERITRLMRAEVRSRSPEGAQVSVSPMLLSGAKDPLASPTTSDVKSTSRAIYMHEAEDSTIPAGSPLPAHAGRKMSLSVLLEGSKALPQALRRTQVEARELEQQLEVERQQRFVERAHEQAMVELRAEWQHDREQLKLESAMAAAHQEEVQMLKKELHSEANSAAANHEAECMRAMALSEEVTRCIGERDAVSDDLNMTRSECDELRAEINELLIWRQAAVAVEQQQSDNLLAQQEEIRLELSQYQESCTMMRAELQARTQASNARLHAAELEETAAQRHGFEAQAWLRSAESEAAEALAMAREMTRSEAAGQGQEAAAYHALAVGEAHAQAEAKKLAAKLVDVESASVLGTAGLTLIEQKAEATEAAQMMAREELEAMESWREEASYYKQECQEATAGSKGKSKTMANRRATVGAVSQMIREGKVDPNALGALGQLGSLLQRQDQTGETSISSANAALLEDAAKKADAKRASMMKTSETVRDDRMRRQSEAIGQMLRRRASSVNPGAGISKMRNTLSSLKDLDQAQLAAGLFASKQNQGPEHSRRSFSANSLGALQEEDSTEDDDGTMEADLPSLSPSASTPLSALFGTRENTFSPPRQSILGRAPSSAQASRRSTRFSMDSEVWDPSNDRRASGATGSDDEDEEDENEDEDEDEEEAWQSGSKFDPSMLRKSIQSSMPAAMFGGSVDATTSKQTSSRNTRASMTVDAFGKIGDATIKSQSRSVHPRASMPAFPYATAAASRGSIAVADFSSSMPASYFSGAVDAAASPSSDVVADPSSDPSSTMPASHGNNFSESPLGRGFDATDNKQGRLAKPRASMPAPYLGGAMASRSSIAVADPSSSMPVSLFGSRGAENVTAAGRVSMSIAPILEESGVDTGGFLPKSSISPVLEEGSINVSEKNHRASISPVLGGSATGSPLASRASILSPPTSLPGERASGSTGLDGAWSFPTTLSDFGNVAGAPTASASPPASAAIPSKSPPRVRASAMGNLAAQLEAMRAAAAS